MSSVNFNWNTLFRSSINYTKLTDFDEVYKKCVFRVAKHDPDARIVEVLSSQVKRKLDQLRQEIKAWVYDAASGQRLEL